MHCIHAMKISVQKIFLNLKKIENTSNRVGVKWLCKCDCGNECDVAYKNLISESIKSCGCMRKGGKYKDITGQKFGKLTALYLLEDTESKKNKKGE